jgi:thiamine-phosphate pyrophosphorylase
VPCLIDDRVDIALVAQADGVHLGEEDLPVKEARQILGRQRIVGATVRRPSEAREAQADGADYVGLGPIYSTSTKVLEVPVLGIEKFGQMVREIQLPVVGIGGITRENISAVAAAGAAAAAVISALVQGDPLENTKDLVRAWERR